MNAVALDVHALTPTITPADAAYFAHLATQRGAGVVAHPATIHRLARACGIEPIAHPAAAPAQLARLLRVPVVADPTIPVGIVTIQPVTLDARAS
jgi:hypothetical protein